MASAVSLSLTAEQAALLVPLLQQLGSSPPDHDGIVGDIAAKSQPLQFFTPARNTSLFRSDESGTSTTSSACLLSPSTCSSGSEFTADELLTKKRKNDKSTSAQAYLLVSMTVKP